MTKYFLKKVHKSWVGRELFSTFRLTTDSSKNNDFTSNQYFFYISAAGVQKHCFSYPWLFNFQCASGISFSRISSLFNNNHK